LEPNIRALHENDDEMSRKEEIEELLIKALREGFWRHYYGTCKKMKMVVSSSLMVSCKLKKMKAQVLVFGEEMVRNGEKWCIILLMSSLDKLEWPFDGHVGCAQGCHK